MATTKRVLSLVFLAGSLLAAMVATEVADASVEKIILTNELITDAETGMQGFKILNPSREADVKFTSVGLEVEYVDALGAKQTVKLLADFDILPEKGESEGETRYNNMMNETLKGDGPRMAGHVIKQTAKGVAESGHFLVLKLDTSRKPGFVIFNYGYSDVTFMSPGNPPVTLKEMIRNNVSMQINEAVAGLMAHKAEQARNPVGFMDGQKASAWGGPKIFPMCEGLFVSTAPPAAH